LSHRLAVDQDKGVTVATKNLFTCLALRTIRAAREMTLKDLQVESGLNVASISQAENGKLLLTASQVRALAGALGVDVGVLLLSPSAVLRQLRCRAGRPTDQSQSAPESRP
jgi:transcriptional regulator with XRE-family HTH domain